MSVQWFVYSNTTRSQQETIQFLRSIPGASESSEFKSSGLVEFRGHALAKISVPRRGSAISSGESFGFIRSYDLVFNKVRHSDSTHLRETIYEVAARFSDWDVIADIWFCENEVGIFKRINGKTVVNIHKYENANLRKWLPDEYLLAVAPEVALRTAEQSDAPKSP